VYNLRARAAAEALPNPDSTNNTQKYESINNQRARLIEREACDVIKHYKEANDEITKLITIIKRHFQRILSFISRFLFNLNITSERDDGRNRRKEIHAI
jgi:hypothetical protein